MNGQMFFLHRECFSWWGQWDIADPTTHGCYSLLFTFSGFPYNYCCFANMAFRSHTCDIKMNMKALVVLFCTESFLKKGPFHRFLWKCLNTQFSEDPGTLTLPFLSQLTSCSCNNNTSHYVVTDPGISTDTCYYAFSDDEYGKEAPILHSYKWK